MGQEAAHICRLTRFLLQVVFAIGADPSFEDHDLTCEACTARHVLLFNCYVDELLESPGRGTLLESARNPPGLHTMQCYGQRRFVLLRTSAAPLLAGSQFHRSLISTLKQGKT
jgi:hypothetical protein